MQTTDFKSLKPTTIVLIVNLKQIDDDDVEGAINIDWAFSLLPITRVQLPEQKRIKQKIKLPKVDIPGSILSLRHKGHTRGIIRSTSKKFFKNSVTIDLSISTKNLCIKLSASKFHVCGANSVEQAMEGIQHIIDKLNEIQEEIDYINKNNEKALTTLRILKEITKGTSITRQHNDSTSMSCDVDNNNDEVIDYTIRNIENFSNYVNEDFDLRIANFLYRQAVDFIYHSHFSTEIDYILTIKNIINYKLEIQNYWKAMVNINYDLGFDINRNELCNLINGREGFFARYNNMMEHSVTIHLPYTPSKERQLRKKAKQPCHTFIVYQSGLVTQSGPGDDIMEEAYYKFNNLIKKLVDDIMIKDCIRKIKYIPKFEQLSTSIEDSDSD